MEGIQTSLISPLFLFSFFLSQNLSLPFSRISKVLRRVNSLLVSSFWTKDFDYLMRISINLEHKNWNMKLTRNSFFSDILLVVRWMSIHKMFPNNEPQMKTLRTKREFYFSDGLRARTFQILFDDLLCWKKAKF
jgi:hypothetical protein